MAFPNINEFKEKLIDGGARPALFRMQITWPLALPAAISAALTVPFHCRLSEIPGVNQNPVMMKYAGREIKFAGFKSYTSLNLTIINDEAFTVRRALETWHEAMNTSETNISALSSPTGDPQRGYAGTGVVSQFTKQGTLARSYVFVDMFPVNIAPIPLDWSSDQIEEYTVEFAYQYWLPGEQYAGSVLRDIAF